MQYLLNTYYVSSCILNILCIILINLYSIPVNYIWASLVAQLVKNLPAVKETQVQSLGWEDSLKKGMAIHSGILAWRVPWTEEPGGL